MFVVFLLRLPALVRCDGDTTVPRWPVDLLPCPGRSNKSSVMSRVQAPIDLYTTCLKRSYSAAPGWQPQVSSINAWSQNLPPCFSWNFTAAAPRSIFIFIFSCTRGALFSGDLLVLLLLHLNARAVDVSGGET